jgi:alpha-methylacyl-CoA racemase
MEGSDVCFAPVLDWDEAPHHPHNVARDAFVHVAGVLQPAPAPRFSRTIPRMPQPPVAPGTDTSAVLREVGLADTEIESLRRSGAIARA